MRRRGAMSRKSGAQPFQESQKKVRGINWIEPRDSATIRDDVNALIDVHRTVSNVILEKMLDLAELDVVRMTHLDQFNELVDDYEELRTQTNLRFDAMARYDDRIPNSGVWVRHHYQQVFLNKQTSYLVF